MRLKHLRRRYGFLLRADRVRWIDIKWPWLRRFAKRCCRDAADVALRTPDYLSTAERALGRFALRGLTLLQRRGRDKTLRAFYVFDERFYSVRAYSDTHKKVLLSGFFSACFIIVAALIISNNVTAYEYSYQGKVLGVVRNQDQVYETVALIGDKLNAENGAEVVIDKEKDIEFTKVIVAGADAVSLDTEEDVLDNLTYLKDVRVKGYALSADGVLIDILSSDADANAVLEEVKVYYLGDRAPSEFKEIAFFERVEITEAETMAQNIAESGAVYGKIMEGVTESKIYAVQAGDTISGIAASGGLTIDELLRLNPDIDPETIYEGQELRLEGKKSLVNLLTTETVVYEEAFPYETVYADSDKLYQGESIEQVAGVNGVRRVTADVSCVNGTENGRVELASEVIAEPVSREVLRGTKELPPLIGKGYFIRPASGPLTSGYGYRWGRMHSGIDIGCRYAPVYAADGGTVIFVGNRGDGYGNVVKIDHGGGRVTMYAHLSGFSVSNGRSVFQGQRIATSGNSGNTTGPHLHFEVHINGAPQNPLSYL
ncbi:MAG: M23 family metallopeptidase [Clostridiales Family XIII bacterium]|nr:M23 family metallopeptidase [Clostridiales Family XIII bacterium]